MQILYSYVFDKKDFRNAVIFALKTTVFMICKISHDNKQA